MDDQAVRGLDLGDFGVDNDQHQERPPFFPQLVMPRRTCGGCGGHLEDHIGAEAAWCALCRNALFLNDRAFWCQACNAAFWLECATGIRVLDAEGMVQPQDDVGGVEDVRG